MFYENFERICRQNATSPSAMAIALGKNKSAASAWKSNGTIPKADELQKLADLLHCRVADFFDDPIDQVLSIHGSTRLADVKPTGKKNKKQLLSQQQLVSKTTEPSDADEAIVVNVDHALPKSHPLGEELDDNIRDFIAIYSAANNRQRNMLMSVVYDFEEKVLNNDGD
ncbi:helix-turn-helix transcriptional regulator [Adlercreutzia sp. R25]|uniref:helix-turn-helix domain-containing protein n=1 Tax=Adlercreutzia shanghongiae TaxID=3111773 RepID=UPI002DB62907|nr:helix-turn-helix transcriptional regulator [Adlercreutzia sp. R25]MEC4272918.1 helix-turn-helix transcriptional regulator [Adlercreutzia sp. R25]